MRGKFNMWLGNTLIIGGVAVLLLPVGPALTKELQYWYLRIFPNQNNKLVSEIKSDEFVIIIPKIRARAKVIPNIDAFNKRIYSQALHSGVAHAKESSLPGEVGNVYLFAHSTDAPWNISRFNAEFYLLNKMEMDDNILINYQGTQYKYQVIEKKIVNSSDLSVFNQPDDQKLLTLQTCWPPGTTWKRLIILAKEIG